MRALSKVIPRGVVRAYADDIAAVVEHLWRDSAKLALLFDEFRVIALLVLKLKKYVVVPLWLFELSQVKAKLRDAIPS